MSKKLWDVIIVGGGPAGITAALRLAREDLDVLVVEAAIYPGAENWSGAVYFAENLADPTVLGPDELDRAPYERRVVKRGFFTCNGPSVVGLEYRNPDTFPHCYTVLRPVYDRYLAERAREMGVTILAETTVDGLIREGTRAIGVHTDRGPLYGRVIFLAEGDASHLVSKEGFEGETVRSKDRGQPAFLQGVKEVIALDPAVIEERFDVAHDEACCYEVLLRNGVLNGRSLRLNMAGFIYTNRSSVSIGLVLPLDNLAGYGGQYNTLMEWFKGLPPIHRLIEGGESVSYGAKIIRGGGLHEMPRLVADGVAIGGAATGIGVDFPYPNFTGPATAMGKLFAEAVLGLRSDDAEPSAENLERLYVQPLRETRYYADVEALSEWPAFIESSESFFGRQVDVVNGAAYVLTRPELDPVSKWWQVVRVVGDTLRGRWRQTIADMRAATRALGAAPHVARHLPTAALAAIPNTLFALVPYGWGRPVGELSIRFWVEGEPVGRPPLYLRWLGARLNGALAQAAHALYANDDARSVTERLETGIGQVLRRVSLWEVLAVLLGGVAFVVTRAAQRLIDLARRAVGRSTTQRLRHTFHGRWRLRWREMTDLSPGRVRAARPHDAKLGDISYVGEPESHIKVFFPPKRPGTLEDPARSSLWSVCPAAVYQINVDRTLHASATVNFENCVKCETCWRIEPRNVDWTRFGHHRLIYEVYTEADRVLRRILSQPGDGAAPEVDSDYWTVSLPNGGARAKSPPDGLREALSAVRTAIELAEARCATLHQDIWEGPRVLEAGQVESYRASVDYLAALLKEASESARAAPVRAAATAADLENALDRLLPDVEAMAEQARAHAESRRFFAADADARQVRDHHLAGLRAIVDRLAKRFDIELPDGPNPVETLREHEVEPAARRRARLELREWLGSIFDRAAVRRLEGGGDLTETEVEVLRGLARFAASEGRGPAPAIDGVAGTDHLRREDVLAELARIDPSLATLTAAHLAATEALAAADADPSTVDDLRSARRFAAAVFERELQLERQRSTGRIPFVPAALAETFVVRGRSTIALFEADGPGVEIHPTTAIGLHGARISELVLHDARPAWHAALDETADATGFAARAHDLVAIALGAGTLLAERGLDHARNRVQFPDHFQDLDGRDTIAKFGAVREHLAEVEVNRLLIETLIRDVRWTDPAAGLEPALAKAAAIEAFGPHLTSITYRVGQVIGGTAFSEDDIFAKMYRDSSVFPHYGRENRAIHAEVGARIAAAVPRTSPLAALASELLSSLGPASARPVLAGEVERLTAADAVLARALQAGLDRAGDDATAVEAVEEVAGALATRLYAWARLLARANRRLEAALPAERHVEAARLWGDRTDERFVALADELASVADRVALGAHSFRLGGYPDTPIATDNLNFSYERDIAGAGRGYQSGSFLLQPLHLNEIRFIPELVWADEKVRSHYETYLELFRERFVEPDYDPPFDRRIEELHYIPREFIDWTREQGFFQVVIPRELGGQGRWKADYYNLCMISKRLADVSHTLTIQANTSIGTTPILLGLFQDIPEAERDLRRIMARPETVAKIDGELRKLIATAAENPEPRALQTAFRALDKEVRSSIGRSRILKKAVFGAFMDALGDAGMAGRQGDLSAFRRGLEQALYTLEGWRERARAEVEELPRRQLAHEFFLRLISARMISAFALTEPSAGSDTARIRTEARLTHRRVYTDSDGVKYFYLDETSREDRRNLCDMTRFEFEEGAILYRYRDDADPAEVLSHEYSYSDDTEKYRYYMHGDRRVDIDDIALIRSRGGQERYEYYILNGAKMWITNGHIAGVQSLYARTPLGATGFMVDAHAEGFFVGKDEEKMGQRGSPTNEITLTNVRVPRECVIGSEGRGQENALETLNVGRAGLAVSSTAGIQQMVTDARDHARAVGSDSAGWVRRRLGESIEEMFAIEALAHNIIGLFDDKTTEALRMESAIGKYHGTEGLHRVLWYLEPIYGIDGQTVRHRIEKDRRDARVMTIYEGTNEIQQFLLLKDLIDMVGRALGDEEALEFPVQESPYSEEASLLQWMVNELRARVRKARGTYGSGAWARAVLQPLFSRLSRMAVWVKMADSALHRAHWIAQNLTAAGDTERRGWCDAAARGFIRRARREFERLTHAYDRDFERVFQGGQPADLALAETVLDHVEPEADDASAAAPRLQATSVERDIEIVVALQPGPRLAPHPRLEEGRLAEHVYTLEPGDRRALNLALALKDASPERVTVTMAAAGPALAIDRLRAGLAAGADRAVLLDTGGATYAEHAVARALLDTFAARDLRPDLLLTGTPADPCESQLAARLAAELGLDWTPAVTHLRVVDGEAELVSDRAPGAAVRVPLPAVMAVVGPAEEPEARFTTRGFIEALTKPLEVADFPSDAPRSDEELSTAAVAAEAGAAETVTRVEPADAAVALFEVGDLGDGAAPEATPYTGPVREVDPGDLDWRGIVFVADFEDDDLAQNARGPLAAARAIAGEAALDLTALCFTEPLDDGARGRRVGRLQAQAPFAQIVLAEHPAFARPAHRAYAEALIRLMGPDAPSRPEYLVTPPQLADALPTLSEALQEAGMEAEELPGVSRIEFRGDDGIAFIRPALGRRLRARRVRPRTGPGMRILWMESEVASNGGGPGASETEVLRASLELDYDPRTDALARALAEARQELGVVTLENAEFVIDVGAGLGSGENLETVVESLRRTLLDLGAPHVEIGASRKVTQDLNWLPDDRQIGQTGVRVNPRVLIALGISGAPQHIDYIGDRAVIFAFNQDAQAPIMTLNQRRPRPKVYPVVGDLFETVPQFIEALRGQRAIADNV